MTHGDIIYQDGRYFRVLNVGEMRRPSDYLEWAKSEKPDLEAQVGNPKCGLSLISKDYACLKVRELDPLIGAMLMALQKQKEKGVSSESV